MILYDNFYTVKSQQVTEATAQFRIELNGGNFVYQAHFPNNPITPGVCLIQMGVELFNLLKGKSFGIKTLKNVKFISPINPLEFPQVDFTFGFALQDSLWQVNVLITEKERVFAKISMVLYEK